MKQPHPIQALHRWRVRRAASLLIKRLDCLKRKERRRLVREIIAKRADFRELAK